MLERRIAKLKTLKYKARCKLDQHVFAFEDVLEKQMTHVEIYKRIRDRGAQN